MNDSIELIIKPSVFERNRRLIINNDFIEVEDRTSVTGITRFEKDEIAEFRYGVKWISGYQFTIGRTYCVDIKSSSGQTINLRLRSLYRINNKKLAEKFSQIVNALYDLHFDKLSRSCLEKFEDGQSFKILGITFSPEGILLDKKRAMISWQEVGTRSYSTYYAVYSKQNPAEHKTFKYLEDWNTGILYSVSREILKRKGLYKE